MERRAEAKPTPDGPAPPSDGGEDVTRRTWLAAERTWLAWWRTGLAVSAVALAVGRLLPDVTRGARWPSRLLGIGYGLLALGVFVIGAVRQQSTAAALRRGSLDELSRRAVIAFTAVSMLLAVGTLAIVMVTL
jgi:inner membrane protein YidH